MYELSVWLAMPCESPRQHSLQGLRITQFVRVGYFSTKKAVPSAANKKRCRTQLTRFSPFNWRSLPVPEPPQLSERHCANRHLQPRQRARAAWVPWEAPAPATEHRYPVTAWPLAVQGPQSVSQCRYNLTLHLHRRKRSKRQSWGG